MNPREITASLAASHIAVVATMYRNSSPHLTPKWYMICPPPINPTAEIV